jgi:hypothetical protein
LIYLSTAIGLTPGGSTHLHINKTYSITINNKTTWITNKTTQITNLEECWPCPVLANYTLSFALQLRKKHGKTSVYEENHCENNVEYIRRSRKKNCYPGRVFLYTWTTLRDGRLGCDFRQGTRSFFNLARYPVLLSGSPT